MEIQPFLLERHFAKYEFEVPFQLSCSDCEPLSLAEVMSMAGSESARLWQDLKFSYTESAGHPLLRREIANLYMGAGPDDVLVCVPEEGIFLTMNSLLTSGDHVVVISPAYQSLHEIAAAIGCRVSWWEADEEGYYQVEALKSLVNQRTRMVVVNFPHNPTGSMIGSHELVEISRFCDLMGIHFFSDEMYRGLVLDPDDHLPSAADLSFTSIALSGMSKSYALPGLRIGWLVCRDRQIMQRLVNVKDYTTICASAPSEILAIIALQNAESILARNLSIIKGNIALVDEFVAHQAGKVFWMPPKAGSVAMLNLPGNCSSEEFCRELLEKHEVLAIGSHLFNMHKPAIRLGLGREGFSQAWSRLEGVLGSK